jgi:hypothetical protein
MDTTTMIIIGLVVLALVALLIWASARYKARLAEKREGLRERFGPEYDRAVQEQGSERKAASKLDDVAKTRDRLEIRELSPAQRDRYASDWMEVQAAFVDAPDAAVRDADRLVGSVMRDRGYPVDDFETQSDMVAADHPTIAQNYRAAHAIRMRTDEGSDGFDTEDLRQAFVHYRLLFAELLADGRAGMDQAGHMDQSDQVDWAHDGVDRAADARVDRADEVDLTGRDRMTANERSSTQERTER